MTKLIDELSVFLPAFNEEANIKDVVLKTKSVLETVADKWELIVINDGSSDATKEIVDGLEQKDSRIRIMSHPANRGYGAALKTGIYSCKYKWISFIDSDGQFDFSEIDKFIEKQKETGADLVIGYRVNRKDTFFRKLNGRGWTFLSNLLFGINVHDVDCGFKLINKKVIDKIPHLESTRGGMISPELLAKAKKEHFKTVEVPVHHYLRQKGQQTGANLNVIVKSFIDLFKLWRKLG